MALENVKYVIFYTMFSIFLDPDTRFSMVLKVSTDQRIFLTFGTFELVRALENVKYVIFDTMFSIF